MFICKRGEIDAPFASFARPHGQTGDKNTTIHLGRSMHLKHTEKWSSNMKWMDDD